MFASDEHVKVARRHQFDNIWVLDTCSVRKDVCQAYGHLWVLVDKFIIKIQALLAFTRVFVIWGDMWVVESFGWYRRPDAM
ncbi:hypothetical protein M408DRAFT_299842 [Serendipita vermifera MAFF 305830]|uniref:Uncharacterized protein n=1 Tax=Serendipita vermifera MAFF 305830 TaxID=933852 RepID=A0A0C3AB02_SERVB|nr:hypothetical protein M408DRAFT_299842 [Serendipita vermifera MAFF 305830]